MNNKKRIKLEQYNPNDKELDNPTVIDQKVKKVKLSLEHQRQELHRLTSALKNAESKFKDAKEKWESGDDILTTRGLLSITNKQIELYQLRIKQAELKLSEEKEKISKQFLIQQTRQHTLSISIDTDQSPQIVGLKQVGVTCLSEYQTYSNSPGQIITQLNSLIAHQKNIGQIQSLIERLYQDKTHEDLAAQACQSILDKAKHTLESSQEEYLKLQQSFMQTQLKCYTLVNQLQELLEMPQSLECRELFNDDSLLETSDQLIKIVGDEDEIYSG